FEWAIKLNRYTLTSIGLWPKSGRSVWGKIACNLHAFIVFLMIFVIILIPAMHSLIRIRSNIMLVIDNLQFTMPISTVLLKIVIIWWKKEAIALLINMIMNDWAKPKTAWDRTIMITRAQTARIITTCCYCVMGISISIAIILPAYGYSLRYLSNITDPGKPLPLQTYYVYDITKSPQYEVTFIMQALTMILCTLPYTGVDTFLALLIFHICGQLDILKNRITRLHKFANYVDALNSCVIDHTRILRAIIVIEDTFNILLLALFVYFGTLFAFYGFLILSLLEDGAYLSIFRVVYLITILINTFGHMCIYCAVGEMLVSQCNQIHYAVYSNKWYTMKSRNAQCLILLMIRSKEPIYITAGKIFPMTMSTFCNLIKTSAGYVSVLLTTKK
ncbi:OrU18, partial [Eciton burchellii]